ncbi:hypothetical protein [Halorubrum tebenquichense]|uniref:Uncharacterized protein n=1 Tax=Halorubrum tebenquichense DSM 14210 TaxID=1227485 RepID=M0DWR3_9EURY|nr:hypothetical protein [Halorubrum tebenquichense]ELZ39157.1 hypothetical protein C472_05247 [Halorubrum tebenquichense DSM 14210]
MIAWLGGQGNVISLLIPLFGICLVLIADSLTETNRAKRYFLSGYVLWFGFRVVIGLQQGTLITFPRPIGLLGALSLLIGFLSLTFYGLCVVWRERDPTASRLAP